MANNIKGITIEIDGNTTSLQKSLKDVDKTIKDTQRSLKDVDKLLKLDPGNTELLVQKQKLLKTAIDETKNRLNQLKEAQKQFGEGTAEYDAIQREIVETEQKLKGLEDEYRNFGSVAGQKIQAVGKDIQGFGGAVKSAGQAFAPVSAAAAGLVGSLAALGVNAVKSADDLNTLSKQTGLSTDTLQKMQYASDLVDVSVDDIVGAVRKMKNNMDSDSAAVKAAWETIGVSATDASGQMRPVEDVFYDVVGALSQIPNETERDQIAMDLFGRSADSLAGIIDDGGASLQTYGQEAENLGLILSGDTLNSLNTLNDTLDQTKAQLSGTFAELGASVAEVLAPVLEQAVVLIQKVADAIREMDPETLQMIITIAAGVAAISPLLITLGSVITIIGGVVKAVGVFVGALAAANPVVLGIIAVIAALVATGAALKLFWDENKEKIIEFCNGVQEKWNAWVDYLKQSVEDTKTSIVETWENIKQGVSDIVENVRQFIEEKWNNIKETISNAITNAKDTVTEKAGEIKTEIETNVNAAIDFLKDLPSKALQWGKDLIGNFVDGLKEKWNDLKDTVSDVAEGIADFLGFSEPKKGALSNFHTFAPDMMQLYAQGIKDNMYLVTDQMQNLADNMAAAVQRPATIYLTNNTVLNGRTIASAVNEELGFLL